MTGEAQEGALAAFLTERAGADEVRIDRNERLVGGAIQENRALDVTVRGGKMAGSHRLVLRTEAKSAVPETRPLDQQFALMRAAHDAGVTVPEPLWYCGDPSVAGAPFLVMRRVAGEALGSRIVRGGPHEALARTLGAELATIHTIAPPRDDLAFLEAPRNGPALDSVEKYRAYLDAEPAPHPALEWGLRWLEANAPVSREIVLAHHDFRTGNYMVADGEVTGILDWEFAGWSDPMEDVAWLCAACWRFGARHLEAGGIASREPYYAGYEERSGRSIDRDVIAYWEAMGHVRWAVIALHQTRRHLSGLEPSLDLALVGRRLPELEYEVLKLTGVMR